MQPIKTQGPRRRLVISGVLSLATILSTADATAGQHPLQDHRACPAPPRDARVELSGTLGVATRFTDRTNRPYAVPTLLLDEPICFNGTTNLGPVELAASDPNVIDRLVARAGQRAKVLGTLDGEVITSDQGPTFPFILFVLTVR